MCARSHSPDGFSGTFVTAGQPRRVHVAECEKLLKCPFFNDQLNSMPAVSGLLKQTYCLGEKSQCARYVVSSAGLPVPSDLYPNDVARARKLLSKP